ncbi:YqjF family protein [Flavihumibacter solisilvae]|uniref:DUF2071 domain-containing protein n=1 Tax=Flavihumibacter solisilvae TaxID=1349421 RepID=A0A0C1L4P5_9BACT|nr:DUF2071 domain-containing protein [Flavihumibacter solisilvae]KIC94506.1 hypothetical protein OI18_11555 [Flavihumibacter solisilvae]
MEKRPFLTAEWRKLAMANYVIDPSLLAPYLPYKTEPDLWNGKCYVSLVGFRFLNTRLKGYSIPFHQNFEEINLRFYVTYKSGNEQKRGVCFIKEIVPRPALTFVANTIYKENYVTLPTKHEWVRDKDSLQVVYGWKNKGSWDSFSVTANGFARDIEAGGDEEFITEHYWGYTRLGNKVTSEYQVAHPRWQVYPIKDHAINVQFEKLYGKQFGVLDELQPESVMLAEGSAISVLGAAKI